MFWLKFVIVWVKLHCKLKCNTFLRIFFNINLNTPYFCQMSLSRFQKNTGSPPPALARAVAQALGAIFIDGRHADKVIEFTLRDNPKAGSSDRAFIAETTYDMVRHYRRYCALLGKIPTDDAHFWQLIAIHLLLRGQPWPPWRELEGLDPVAIQTQADAQDAPRALLESIPDWLDELGSTELVDAWPPTLHALNQPAQVVLRVNTLKADRNSVQKRLAEEGVETMPEGDAEALVLTVRKNVFQTEAFKKGLFEVQDYSSQLVAPLLAPEPGMRVIDACAGGGGKALHLAALMQNKGSLIALDTLAWKLDALKLRARRAGASNIETRPIDNRKVIKRLQHSADRLLLDVPCSGLGVLRRNPDTKWKLKAETMESLRHLQQSILQDYSTMLRPGGQMVYATCSVLPSENQVQVQAFLASEAGQGFQLRTERRILPQDEGYDGFYMALLAKE